jgi:hypothetical protein
LVVADVVEQRLRVQRQRRVRHVDEVDGGQRDLFPCGEIAAHVGEAVILLRDRRCHCGAGLRHRGGGGGGGCWSSSVVRGGRFGGFRVDRRSERLL